MVQIWAIIISLTNNVTFATIHLKISLRDENAVKRITAMGAGIVLVAFIAVGTVKSQTGSRTVEEPRYINSFFAVDDSGKLIELERRTVTFHAKTRMLPGYATVKMTTEFKPGRSLVRVDATAQFIVRGRASINPVSRFELRALKGSKDHREFVMTQAHGSVFGGSATSNPEEGAVEIQFEEYGGNSYRITPVHPLAPGEYALATRGYASELYCFGVDRK
jgi:hypothetical protein